MFSFNGGRDKGGGDFSIWLIRTSDEERSVKENVTKRVGAIPHPARHRLLPPPRRRHRLLRLHRRPLIFATTN